MKTPHGLPTLHRRDTDKTNPVLRTIEAHWQDMRGEDGMPNRSDIDPSVLENALPHTFILERVAPGVGRMRVAGQALHETLGMDPRGMPLSAFFAGDDRSTLAVHVETAFADPAIVALPLSAPATFLRKPVTGQLLLMPLRDDLGDITRVLGGLVTDMPLRPRHRRLMIDAAMPVRIDRITAAPQRQIAKGPDTVMRPALQLVVNNG